MLLIFSCMVIFILFETPFQGGLQGIVTSSIPFASQKSKKAFDTKFSPLSDLKHYIFLRVCVLTSVTNLQKTERTPSFLFNAQTHMLCEKSSMNVTKYNDHPINIISIRPHTFLCPICKGFLFSKLPPLCVGVHKQSSWKKLNPST